MLNREKHQLIMGQILRDIYTDVSLAPLLGFKGGTCAFLFYDLTRFSVDLDFDLLSDDPEIAEIIYDKMEAVLNTYGRLKDAWKKQFTLLFLLDYGKGEHNIKVEINTRMLVSDIRSHYEIRDYLGISMLVGKKGYLFASKLAALSERRTTAMRDIYDIWFFGRNRWDINTNVLRQRTGKEPPDYLEECIGIIERVKENEVLQGLGELISGDKNKAWVKAHLREEAIFQLRNYQEILRRQ